MKTVNSFVYLLILAAIGFSNNESALSHSGGLNAQGCHAGSRPYHCPRSSYSPTSPSAISNSLVKNRGTVPTRGSAEEQRIMSTWRSKCNCPYNLKSNGHRCDGLSAWSKPGGAEPLCYVEELVGNKPSMVNKQEAKANSVFVNRNEEFYSSSWCTTENGTTTTLADGTKPDCLIENHVVEFDWGKKMKPYECVGQALHYAQVTGKKPMCILIQGETIDDHSFSKAVSKAKNPYVELKCMNAEVKIITCPESAY